MHGRRQGMRGLIEQTTNANARGVWFIKLIIFTVVVEILFVFDRNK